MVTRIRNNVVYVDGVPTDIAVQTGGRPQQLHVVTRANISDELAALGDVPRWSPSGALVGADGGIVIGASLRMKHMTLAEMLSYTGQEGDRCYLSNYPSAPAFFWDSAASRWRLTAPWVVVSNSTVYTRNSANAAGDTTDALLASFTLPGGVLGPHGKANIRYYFTSGAGTTVGKILFVKWGSTGLPGTNLNAAQTGRQSSVHIYNDGSLIAQKMINADNETATATNAIYTLAGDTSNNITLGVYGRFAAQVAGESLSLQRFELTLYP